LILTPSSSSDGRHCLHATIIVTPRINVAFVYEISAITSSLAMLRWHDDADTLRRCGYYGWLFAGQRQVMAAHTRQPLISADNTPRYITITPLHIQLKVVLID